MSTIDAILFDMDGVLMDSEPLHLRATQFALGIAPATRSATISRSSGPPTPTCSGSCGSSSTWTRQPTTSCNGSASASSLWCVPKVGASPGCRTSSSASGRRGSGSGWCRRPRGPSSTRSWRPWDSAARSRRSSPATRSPAASRPLTAISWPRAGSPSDPERCFVVEDTRNGVLAAKAAGMTVAAVPSPASSHEDFSPADLVLPSLEALPKVLERNGNGHTALAGGLGRRYGSDTA